MTQMDTKSFALQDLLDVEALRALLEHFSQATGIATALVSHPEQAVLITTGWQDICTQFHRAAPGTAGYCLASNQRLTEHLSPDNTANIEQCQNGLVDGATPIIIRGTHVASLYIGQVFLAAPDEAAFRARAELHGFNREAYLAAMRAVPVVDEAQLTAALAFLRQVAQLITKHVMSSLEIAEAGIALRESEAKSRTILDSLDAGVLIVDAVTHEILSLNPKGLALCGAAADTVTGRICHNFICPAEHGKCPITDLGQIVDESERVLLTVQGEKRPIIKSVVRTSISDRDCLIESFFDISAWKQTQADLQASHDRMGALLNAIPDLLFELAGSGHILKVHSNDLSQLYLPPAEFLGRHVGDVLPPHLAALITEGIANATAHIAARGIEYQLPLADGLRWYDMSISRCDQDGQRFLALTRDITARKQVEQALHESQEQYRYLVDNTNDFILQIDLQGRFIFGNSAGECMTGYALPELLAMNIRQVVAPAYHAIVNRRLRQCAAGGTLSARPYDMELIHRDGHRTWVELTTSSVFDADGRPRAVQAIARNISERKRLEQRMTRLRDCFLDFGPDPLSNINRLTQIAGELLGATAAVYNRLEGDNLHARGQWNTPPDFLTIDCAAGHICAEVIQQAPPTARVIRHLAQSPYATTDPNVARYGLQTYIGNPVFCEDIAIGVLSVVFTRDVAPPDDDLRLISILAMAIAVEELRLRAEDALRDSEGRYRQLFNTMSEGFALLEILCDAQGSPVDYRYLETNPAFERMTGLRHADDVGRLKSAVMPNEDPALLAMFGQVALTGIPVHVEHFDTFLARHFQTYAYRPAPGQFATVFIDITERKRTEERLNYLAYYDELTGLPNRFLLADRLGQELTRAARQDTGVALLFLDLDGFKEVNDTLGHPLGDRLLQAVAQRLATGMRESDTVARMGGDEFVVILSELAQPGPFAEAAARRLLAAFTEPFRVEEHNLFITASIGITVAPHDGTSVDVLMRNADMAMYKAKSQGRATFCFYSAEMSEVLAQRRVLAAELRTALERQEFYLCYQPQVDVTTRRIFGVEALLRWRHPTLGEIPPLQFIPVAEETGLIEPIGEWVLHAACEQACDWLRHGHHISMAVNLSARQFERRQIVETVRRTLAETGLPADALELEITESTAMQDIDYAITTLSQLRALGVQIAIDDFGTGHCSFGYLKRFPVSTLKIDRTFIQDMIAEPHNAAIVQAITVLGQAFNLSLIAECVETRPQLDRLRESGCQRFQGFLFSKPLSADDCGSLIADASALFPELLAV